MTNEERVRLWDAINAYAIACGGDPAKHVYGNTPRQKAVAEVERAVRAATASLRHAALFAAGVRGGPGAWRWASDPVDDEAAWERLLVEMRGLGSVEAIRKLCWSVVANAGRLSLRGPAPRWSHVASAAGLGSTSAKALCVAAGFDPDEKIGKWPEPCETCAADEEAEEPDAPEPPVVRPGRCAVCDWPLKATIEDGCTAESCSYCPEQGSDEWHRIQERRKALAEMAATEPTPTVHVPDGDVCPLCDAPVIGVPVTARPNAEAVLAHHDCLFPARGASWVLP